MQGAPLNYAALLRSLKLRLILRQHQNPAHFEGFIFFRNPKIVGWVKRSEPIITILLGALRFTQPTFFAPCEKEFCLYVLRA